MRPSAKSLLLDLLSTVGRGSAPVRALLRAGDLFGVEANAIRVALARLRGTGLVASDERGRYRLGEAARAVSGQVASWRRPGERVRPWRGGWLAVHTTPLGRSDRPALRRRQRALAFLGFRPLETGIELRPDNLSGSLGELRSRLFDLGLGSDALVCRLSELDPRRDADARRLWDVATLRARYRDMNARLERSAARLPTLPRGPAMVESFLIGGEAIRLLAYDPLLPAEIGPDGERTRLVTSMRSYDRQGRRAWRGMLEVEGDRSPADVRGFEAVGALAGAGGP